MAGLIAMVSVLVVVAMESYLTTRGAGHSHSHNHAWDSEDEEVEEEDKNHTFELECEIVGEMSTFVISTQEEYGLRIPYLESPEV